MSQLMHIRQRIQAIQTIKKIAHAMRLISMSTHARMKHQEKPLGIYRQKIGELISNVQVLIPNYHNRLLQPNAADKEHKLIILIGSQKGLCGNFNTMLMHHFNSHTKNLENFSLITVGKRATQLVSAKHRTRIIAEFNTFAAHNVLTVAQEILQRIIQAHRPYGCVVIIGNYAASFFAQKPITRKLIPAEIVDSSNNFEYETPQSNEVGDYLTHLYLLSQIQHGLFESLLAEHAARFISMDNSTRNAELLLEKMQLDYNKLRQANITRELSELSAFFLQ